MNKRRLPSDSWVHVWRVIAVMGMAPILLLLRNHLLIGIIAAIGWCIGIWCLSISAKNRYEQRAALWYIKYHKSRINEVTICAVDGVQVEDNAWVLDTDSFVAAGFNIYTIDREEPYKVMLWSDADADLYNRLMKEATNSEYQIDYTQILAVNNEQVATSSSSPSIGGALLGGMVFGPAGFVLGALHSKSRTTIENGDNEYTFLIVTKDGERDVVKVAETEPEFKSLLKLARM